MDYIIQLLRPFDVSFKVRNNIFNIIILSYIRIIVYNISRYRLPYGNEIKQTIF